MTRSVVAFEQDDQAVLRVTEAGATILNISVSQGLSAYNTLHALKADIQTFLNAYAAPTPVSVLPASGDAAGGTAVTISGTNLAAVTGVKIGSVACTSVVAVSDTTATAVSPAKSAGTYDVNVTAAHGTGVLAAAFTTS